MDRIKQLRDAFESAHANDWSTTNVGVAARMTVHETPQLVLDAGWYPGRTYQCIEILDFTFTARDRVPIIVYKQMSRPWVDGTEQRISFRKALNLLAQPLASSDFHNH